MFIINRASERRSAGHGDFNINIVIPGRNVGNGDLGFFNLGRFDDAHLKPGAFIGMHPHQNDEILTLMRSGTMLHKDSMGKEIAVTPQNIMLMNAGSGINHEESIPVDTYKDDVRLLQIFIRPENENDTPQVQFADAGELIANQWRLVAGLKSSNAPLEIKSNILVYDIEMENNTTINSPAPFFKDTIYFVYLFDGEVNINQTQLKQGDSIITDEKKCSIETSSKSTIVCFMIDKEATYTRNGMYSGMKK
ncbi:pirin family protein [Elizabethkingia anophelis]|nr:pirin family protein [Elizabethkingia anophelis]MCT4100024.1 pirin family protein [Elizabethkingia anophelis]MCT4164442.1 pirin family protein [Elizabethkingia anophelis]MDV3592592.1 pimeloyl-CoA dehydrogenase [Elizabethkingia anophelis]HAY3538552.1 pimeloyl-CoA dehydrogenase [Elizabethkingia anophelis]